MAHLQSLHTTTGLFVGEWQDAVLANAETILNTLAPRDLDWRDNNPDYSDCSRENADAHLRGMLTGQLISLQVHEAAPLLGVSQRVIFAELDGPRVRTISVQIPPDVFEEGPTNELV